MLKHKLFPSDRVVRKGPRGIACRGRDGCWDPPAEGSYTLLSSNEQQAPPCTSPLPFDKPKQLQPTRACTVIYLLSCPSTHTHISMHTLRLLTMTSTGSLKRYTHPTSGNAFVICERHDKCRVKYDTA